MSFLCSVASAYVLKVFLLCSERACYFRVKGMVFFLDFVGIFLLSYSPEVKLDAFTQPRRVMVINYTVCATVVNSLQFLIQTFPYASEKRRTVIKQATYMSQVNFVKLIRREKLLVELEL